MNPPVMNPTVMNLGMIGLGKMGANMAERLVRGGHRVVGYDFGSEARTRAASAGIVPVDSLTSLVAALPKPRAVWMMVPAGGAVDSTLEALAPLLTPGDIIIDGGNSNYRDSQRRAKSLAEKGFNFIDVGTSGGVWGLANGYSLMIGGDEAAVASLNPIFATLAPSATSGWGRVGPSGAGHFTKMIHNGIEYGLMQAYAEGFSVMKHKTEFDLDLHQIATIWQDGSVVRSWLLDLTAQLLEKNPHLDQIAPFVADSGEGRWTVAEAIELGVAAPVMTLALLQRLRSRDTESFSDRVLAGLRNEFGGHGIKST
jgi:6-phosphogluconate dehydrogenase